MIDQMDVLSIAEESGLIDWRSDCGKYFNFTDEADEPSSVLLQRFACTILERAAIACESRMSNAVLSDDSSVFDCEAAGCAIAIRALKPQLDNPCN